MTIEVVETLRDLVRIPSVNPMGRAVEGEGYYEHRLTNYLVDAVERIGLRYERHCLAPRRDNLVARLDGGNYSEKSAPLVLLEAHQDTVPVDGMTIDPWSAELRDGRVYGRGACDVKGGMACMLAAVSRLAEERPAGMPAIVLACSVNEEYGFSGASHLRRLWTTGDSSILPRPPDAIIVAEPTELNVVVAHKGVMRWRCHTRGRAAHSSTPSQGENAIYLMGEVLGAIQRYRRELDATIDPHPLVGPPTVNVGTVCGGTSVNTVPDKCTIEVERRVLPDEDPHVIYQNFVEFLDRQCQFPRPIDHEPPYMLAGGLSDRHNKELAQHLVEIARRVGVPSQPIGVPFGTDACQLAADGAPTVVFGPGSLQQAHTVDEWIEVEQLEKAVEIICDFLRSGIRT